jgi:hypothetical protein
MDTFSPEFSGFWLKVPEQRSERQRPEPTTSTETLSPAQEVALEELAERVNAARSVI